MKKLLSIITPPQPHWVGDGFPAKTLFSYQAQGHSISPFLLLDHAGPMAFSATSNKRGVGVHPHRGFETVTLVYAGEVAHKDSTGEQGVIGPGDIQWMTAGKGILHEEYHSDDFAAKGGMMEMVQLWVNLPRDSKMTKPNYQTILANQIPSIELPDHRGRLRLIAGKIGDVEGPTKTHSPLLLMDGEIKTSGHYSLNIEEGWSAIVLLRQGSVSVNKQILSQGQTMVLSQTGVGLEIEAQQDSEIVILAGEPINEPIKGYGPFVMNTEGEIKQAITDFQSGNFA